MALNKAKCQTKRCEAILIDFDGVLRHWPATDNSIENKYGLVPNSIRAAAFEQTLLNKATRGLITDDEWRLQIADTLQGEKYDSRILSAINEWSAHPGKIDMELLGLLSLCKSETNILLITNATSRLDDDLVALGLENWFHGVINSSEVGYTKPEPEIFQTAIEACNCMAEETAYIDDSLANVLAAAEAGMMSHQYTGLALCKQYLVDIGILNNDD